MLINLQTFQGQAPSVCVHKTQLCFSSRRYSTQRVVISRSSSASTDLGSSASETVSENGVGATLAADVCIFLFGSNYSDSQHVVIRNGSQWASELRDLIETYLTGQFPSFSLNHEGVKLFLMGSAFTSDGNFLDVYQSIYALMGDALNCYHHQFSEYLPGLYRHSARVILWVLYHAKDLALPEYSLNFHNLMVLCHNSMYPFNMLDMPLFTALVQCMYAFSKIQQLDPFVYGFSQETREFLAQSLDLQSLPRLMGSIPDFHHLGVENHGLRQFLTMEPSLVNHLRETDPFYKNFIGNNLPDGYILLNPDPTDNLLTGLAEGENAATWQQYLLTVEDLPLLPVEDLPL